ncbi:Wzz/FepE/Etk N-terminal domain-containing protein [Mesorhizobium sp. RP14(2022)]|uniref:Wzz/FepE/Etk N-terminal domain-containing protein n=1 Tax=Mesorhizobium liriopis TaxID=2953882 RepID=A0ABT1C2X5_9HYPH|nr:Wzz/FepE/Etk N-terminal domain-containing protein [Mesorhizobium liriopis]MCO6049132.1 Wzz/FepE/Etk N-terminal domain-containing protein [Mesorhizobium liriopis]
MGDFDIRHLFSVFLKRLPLFLGIVALGATLGIATALLLPPVYRASTKLLAEAPQIPSDLAKSTVPTSALEQIQIIEQEITTSEIMLDLADRLNIFGERRAQLSDDTLVDNMRARILFEQVPLTVTPGEQSANVFNVSFDARDPVLAARVANELADIVLDRNMRVRTGRAGDTQAFFNGEVSRLGNELTGLESQILRFKNANKDALPDSIDFRRTRQSNGQEKLALLDREEAGLRLRRDNLVRLFENTGQIGGAGPLTPDQQMLQDLNRALSDQLSIYSEASPNIVTLKGRIAAVQRRVQDNQTANTTSRKTEPSSLDIQLSEIDERLSQIGRERSSIEDDLSTLGKTIAATPTNQTTLNALERSRDNVQAQYNTAVAKLAEASTGEQIEMRSKGGRISVIEQAQPPAKPESPKKSKIVAMGLGMGIVMGLGLVVLLELLDKSIRRPTELAQMLEIQPLATIPYIWIEGEKRTQQARLAFGTLTMACALPLFLLVVQHYRQPITGLIEHVAVSLGSNRVM